MDTLFRERFRVIALYDADGQILAVHQRMLLRLYSLRDLSLGEIAERLEVSRQAIYDSVRRSVDELERLEHSLHALERRRIITERTAALEGTIKALNGKVDQKTLDHLLDHVAAIRKTAS